MMKKILPLLSFLFFSIVLSAQDEYGIEEIDNLTQCSTATISDNQDVNMGYTLDGSEVITLCPDDPDSVIQLNFTEFNIINSYDLSIYDGDSENAPLIGSYTSNENPGTVIATPANNSGCLTIVYTGSGAFFPGSAFGWSFESGCSAPCQYIETTIENVFPSEFQGGVYSVEFGASITFSGSAEFADGISDNAIYEWDFGDGTVVQGQNLSYTYGQSGDYEVTLTVTDENGCVSVVNDTVSIEVEGESAPLCEDINPFCAGNDALVFPNSYPGNSDQPSAENGPDYGCLGSQPYPSWFYIQIEDPGTLNFTLEQNSSPNFNGQGHDVDFIIWGPFDDYEQCDNLTAQNTVDCSFSAAAIENVNVTNAQEGEIYILLVTNYSQNQGYISLQQTSGQGSTDCSIVNTVLGDDQEFCSGETFTINGTTAGAVDYEWSIFNDGTGQFDLIPGETNPTLEVSETGLYQLESFDIDGDSSTDEIEVTFYDVPIVTEITEVQDYCISGGGDSSLDLNQFKDPLLDDSQDPNNFNYTFYASEADFNNDTPIGTPDDFDTSSQNQELFVTLENPDFEECSVNTSFIVNVSEIEIQDLSTGQYDLDGCYDPVASPDGASFDLTIHESFLLTGLDSDQYLVEYFESQVDAENSQNAITDPVNYQQTEGQYTVYVRVERQGSPNCNDTTSFSVSSFSSGEIVALPSVLNLCEEFLSDASFDLQDNTPLILGGQDASTFNITYHPTLTDAEDATSPLPLTGYQPSAEQETIYVRIENVNNTDCYNTGSFNIQVNLIRIGDLTAEVLEECDEDSNGSASFDLTELNGAALDGQDATAYTVSYYESQADAETGMAAAIANPSAYVNQSANPQTIFVRVENNNDPSCYETSSFLIQSFPSGIANTPNTLYICDNGQSTNVIDLTQNTPIVLGAQSLADFNITYYETQAAADANEVGITDPASYEYLEEDQEIFVRIENIEREECYNLTSFELDVTTVVIGAVDLQQECDNGTPGTAFFDLTENNIAALAGQSPSSYTVDYYASQGDLDNEVVIADYTNYENMSNPQTIYVKVSSSDTEDCYLTTSFEIEATPSAAIFDPSPLMACDSDNDGFYTLFDLTSKDEEITGGNDDVSVSYHLTLSDANNDVDAIESPYSNISAFNQTVYVRALDELNGCVQTTTLELQVYDRPMIETPADLEACDDGNADGQTYFDLTSVEAEVLNGLTPADYEITYHNNEADAIAGEN
ncbi:MAG: PKD domain-containing protein, partial [Mesonia sp.]|uniref:PKD domain-containing protein n=1 Tax=Mesonia sp. TaxID=1960830 RepID=UPI003242AB80